MNKNALVIILGALEGFKVRFKELHWSATTMVEHKLADDILSSLIEFQDSLAEEGFGIVGNPELGDLVVNASFAGSISEGLDEILTVLIQSRQAAEGRPGILAIIDAYVHDINKFKYLATLS